MLWLLIACSTPQLPVEYLEVLPGDTGAAGTVRGPADEPWLLPTVELPVIVIGGGPAGLATAAAAQDVLFFEAADRLGGRAQTNRIMFWLAETTSQEDFGIYDTLEMAADDWEDVTGSPPTEDTLSFLEDGPWIHDQLTGLGIEWISIAEDPQSGIRRLHGMGGDASFWSYLEAAQPAQVDVRMSSPVSAVVVEDRRVVGVEVDGEQVYGRAVVIATGGFAGNFGMMERVAHTDVAWKTAQDGGATGTALSWARDQGWGTADIGSVGWFRRYVSTREGPIELHDHSGVMPWIWVDGDGERFTDESDIDSVTTGAPCLEHAPVWGVSPRQAMIDALIDDDDLDLAMERGEVRCFDDARALAHALHVDAAGLEATVASVIEAGQSDVADRYGRSPETFPDVDDVLCGYKLGLVAQKSFGGLAVDSSGRVLRRNGTPVPGLYAVGEAAGMAMPGLGGHVGFDGSMAAVVWSGWRVGESLRLE